MSVTTQSLEDYFARLVTYSPTPSIMILSEMGVLEKIFERESLEKENNASIHPLFPPEILQSSKYGRTDVFDEINDTSYPMSPNRESSYEMLEVVLKDSTNSNDINKLNDEFKQILSRRTPFFIWKLKHTDFEDGIVNDLIDEVDGYIRQNKYVTISWLYELYADNQKDADILSGLLRIIGMTIQLDDTNKLLVMVKAGLSEPQSKTQEAAIMVIENWRTENCLCALESVEEYSSTWINEYAKKVISELKEELK